MVAINSTGFDPDIHIAESSSRIAAKVRAVKYPGTVLLLTEEGATWAGKLMAQRPYFKENWSIERVN